MASGPSRGRSDPLDSMPPEAKAAMEKVISSYKGDRLDPSAFWDHMMEQDPEDLRPVASALHDMKPSDGQLAAFDYTEAPMRKNSHWVMQLVPMAYQGKDAKDRRSEPFPGSTPIFDISINDDRFSFILRETIPPGRAVSSDLLLRYLKRAIAFPVPPKTPSIPHELWIGRDLSPHIDALLPFLDSLPSPFTWRLQPLDQVHGDVPVDPNVVESSIAKAIQRADEEKRLGNAAFGRKEKIAALDHYTKAHGLLADAAFRTLEREEKRQLTRSLAVCHANRAAAWLIEGTSQDAQNALRDAKQALDFDCDYGKAYYRQAKAYLLMDAREKSINVLTKALKRPKLSSDQGLVEGLVEAYGGFPETPDELRSFCHRVFIDKYGDRRARGVEGFVRRADAHVKKVLGPNFSATTV
ncbi:uncharacterized protein B0H18DRAFT_1042181 [Fomitopsis serialis]|uniref:uncharacterized protein n=1 Tax=Fomitopsis serialis TaxID=139415 RepID=UPI0020075D87|nr:uncharacterized protein B0H18DRAFT_1042181 [Neoantrodia serialis]KAH9915214.1 hypothetical protein B0H18DRAFT_1042181 [Neoantrodia serialis]